MGQGRSNISTRIRLCLAVACFIDGVDLGLFPASFHAMEQDMGFTPYELGNLSMKTGIAYCFSSLLWGFLADRMNRKALLITVTAALALVMVALSRSTNRLEFDCLRIAAGAITAAATPIMQSLIAQVVPKEEHGYAFGQLQLGSILSGACASVLVACTSWRAAYLITALSNLGLCFVLGVLHPDIDSASVAEKFGSSSKRVCAADLIGTEVQKIMALARIRTFVVLICCGMVGCIPWSALQFLQLYFESAGFTTGTASALITVMAAGKALGAVLGGLLGDIAAARLPMHGRALVAQSTVMLGMICMCVLFRGCAHNPGHFASTAVTALAFGLTSSWAGPAADRPMWAELAGPENSAMAIAIWTFLAGSFSSTLGAPLVGWVADAVLGYKVSSGGDESNADNAMALGSALLMCTIVPWLLCFAFYSFVHITYPVDISCSDERRPLKAGAHARGLSSAKRFSDWSGNDESMHSAL